MAQTTTQDFCISLTDLSLFLKTSPEKLKTQLERFLKAQKSKSSTLWMKGSLISPQLVRRFLVSKGIQYPKKVVSVQMLKGGVAKTTSVLNLGIRAAMYGARVLFIDLDQQANLTYALGVDGEDKPIWVDILEKKAKISDCVVRVDGDDESGIDLIPSGLNNSVLDRVLLNSNRNWAQSVKVPLALIRDQYDLVLIDTAPALSAINTAVTCASDEVLLPVNPDKFSMIGLRKNLKELSDVRIDFGLRFTEKILFTKFDSREKASHELLQSCIVSFADRLMKSYIRVSSEVKKSIGADKSIFDGRSTVKDDYDLATQELLELDL